MNLQYLILSSLLVFSTFSCRDESISDLPDITSTPIFKNVNIDVSQRFQTIEGFGASDCWLPNYIGKYWDEEQKEGIARLLFSKEIFADQPSGIGLSSWRFNLGGGTANQGSDSDINDVVTRAESFLEFDGTLNWNRQAGQQYFLQKAKNYGCEQFVMFSNTPPVTMTLNGKGYSQNGASANLKDDCYDDFADYMTLVAKHFNDNMGIKFALISPVNEPQYNWDKPDQEGSAWQHQQIKRLAIELSNSIKSKGLDSKILLSEVADWDYAYLSKNNKGRDNVINALFNKNSPDYVGDIPHVAPIIAGHSYWTDISMDAMTLAKRNVKKAAESEGVKVYQTEWSMLSDGYRDGYPGHQQATYMDIAIYMSKVIHTDMVEANAASWSYWTALGVERWSHKNRFMLINVIPQDGPYGDITKSGTHIATKNLWVLGNFSRFIRPGYQRIALDIVEQSKSFMGSAYISPDQKTLVCVYTNVSPFEVQVKPDLENISAVKTYTTNVAENLKESTKDVSSNIIIGAQSVVTVVYNL